MSAGSHPVNSTPRKPLSAPLAPSTPLAGAARRPEGLNGPQAGAQSLGGAREGTEPARPYRVLVTGSRTWDDVTTIGAALEQALTDVGPRPVLVVHGDCSSGADWHADHYARWLRGKGCSIDVERHPAQGHPTQDFGPWPGAGPRRNAYMVSLGADLTLAFIGPCTSPRCRKPRPHPSHGASGCADLAEASGIPVRRWTA